MIHNVLMEGRPTHNKRYLFNSVCMTITMILIGFLTVLSISATKTYLKFIFGAGSFVLVFIAIFEAWSIAIRMIFVDSFTQSKNSFWVMFKAHSLLSKKKLNQYTGIYTNVKEFKYLNQRFGTPEGDKILQMYTKQLFDFVKGCKGYCGRLGGDNYFVVIPNEKTEELLEHFKKQLIDFEYEGTKYTLRLQNRSGYNHLTNDIEFKNLIFYSNIAFTYAKENFLDVVEFKPSMLDDYMRDKKFVSDIQRALKNDEFIPYYQPKVDAKTRTLTGAEALVRWNKNGQLVPPTEFINAFEKAGIIDDIDFCVYEKVCRDMRAWIDQGIRPVRVSTNFSKLNLKNPDFIKRIIEIKDKYRIDGKYLEVELTESAGITNFGVIQQFAKEVKAAGMSVAIDDFGTGYSSLSMLQTVHADVVKMDKSFLDNCFKDDGDKQFIVDVITILRHQNSEVLFEGVENKEQLDFLCEYDCNSIQGFYFDKPLTHDDFQKRLMNPKYNI